MRRTLSYIVLAIMLAGCSGDTKTVYVYSDGENDAFGAETDSSLPEHDIDSTSVPDGSDDDQFVQDNGGFDGNEQDHNVHPDSIPDGQIDPELEEDFSVDVDVSDPDQQTDLSDFDQLVDPDVDYPDQAVETDDTNPTDTEDQDSQDSTPDQFIGDDNSTETHANVSVASWPIGAQTTIVGMGIDYSDQTSFEVILEYGTYEITMTHPNYVEYSAIFTVPDVTELSVILEPVQVDLVEVTFTSAIPGVEAVYVTIDSQLGQEYATPFTHFFQANSQHMIYCSKDGYIEESFDIEVGEVPFEYQISLQPYSYESLCGWINGEFEFIEGSEPPVDNVNVVSVVFDNHCEITGLEPPLPIGLDHYLYGEYEPYVYNQLMLTCYGSCSGECLVYQEMQVIECSYTKSSVYHTIVWHKVN